MSKERTQTIRQEMISHPESGPMTVRDLSQKVGVMEKEVFHHLEFIEKTIRSQKKESGWSHTTVWIVGLNSKIEKNSKNPENVRNAGIAESPRRFFGLNPNPTGYLCLPGCAA